LIIQAPNLRKLYFSRCSEVNELIAPKKGQIDLIASHLGLINVDLDLATLLGGANLTQSKRKYIKVHGKLRTELLQLAEDKDYDIILIDCPPNFNIVTKNAVVASDLILVPAKPDYLSTLGIDYLYRSVKGTLQNSLPSSLTAGKLGPVQR